MSLPSSLLAFALFKTLQRKYSSSSKDLSTPRNRFFAPLSEPFTDVENVFVQSLAVAVGTGPLAFGFVGVIPALEKFLTPEEAGIPSKHTVISILFARNSQSSDSPISFSFLQLCFWSAGLSLFGVFFGVLLRKPIIVKEKLKFPSGSATATMIAVLHQKEITNIHDDLNLQPNATSSQPNTNITISAQDEEEELLNDNNRYHTACEPEDTVDLENLSHKTYSENIHILLISFVVSASYSLISYFFPILRNIPIFGKTLANDYLWTFQPSPAYFGQGIIMGLPTVSSMLFGAILGWAVLGPMSKRLGWAPGPVDDWKTGAQGWILWISLAIMVADTVISFLTISGASLYKMDISRYFKGQGGSKIFDFKNITGLFSQRSRRTYPSSHEGYSAIGPSTSSGIGGQENLSEEDDTEPDALPQHIVNDKVALFGLVLSCIFCVVALKMTFALPMRKEFENFNFNMPVLPIIIAVFLALLLAILGVRALGETDLNPVSGIGKISQLIFAVLVPPSTHPAAVLINLIAGGITEAGAQQAGDLMQDLKTGHLVGASPRAQFFAQLIGSLWSVVMSAAVYRLYDKVYTIPGNVFRIPTAVVWIDCARLVTGKGLPRHALKFSWIFGCIFAFISAVKTLAPLLKKSKEHGAKNNRSPLLVDRNNPSESNSYHISNEQERPALLDATNTNNSNSNVWKDHQTNEELNAGGSDPGFNQSAYTETPRVFNSDSSHETENDLALPLTPPDEGVNTFPKSNLSDQPSSTIHRISTHAKDVLLLIAKHSKYIPSGVAVGIGIYNTPSFTLARFFGGLFAEYWMRTRANKTGSSDGSKNDYNTSLKIVVLSSGLVLGEGVFSIVSLILTSLGVPHF